MMQTNDTTVRASENLVMGGAIDLYIFDRVNNTDYLGTVSFGPIRDGEAVKQSVRLKRSAAQSLMDELWRCGIRPTDTATVGHVGAIERHLSHVTRLLDQTMAFNEMERQVNASIRSTQADMLAVRFAEPIDPGAGQR